MASLLKDNSIQSNSLLNQLNDIEFTHLEHAQNYNPLYENLFEITPTNYNSIQLNHKFRLKELVAKDNDCIFKGIIFNHKNNETRKVPIFFKYSPLLDPIKFMMGKYEDSEVIVPNYTLKDNSKVYHTNNSAYTDGFFYFLSSLLLNHHHFVNGIDFYGSYTGIKHGFKVNIDEDLSMIHQSNYYQLYKDEKFNILGNIDDYLYNINDSRNYKEKLNIQTKQSLNSNLLVDIMDKDMDDLFVSPIITSNNEAFSIDGN